MKRIKKVVCLLSALFLLSGCNASKYDEALKLYKDGQYADALEVFSGIQEYEDSSEMLSIVLEDYVRELLLLEKYDEAIQALNMYSNASNCSKKIEEISEYKKAKEYIKVGDFFNGLEILRGMDEEFIDVKKLIDSYDKLCDSSFIGLRSVSVRAETGTVYKMTIRIKLEYEEDEFVLDVYKMVQSDGYIIMEKEYSVYASEIEDETISKGKYTWKIVDGYLVETDNGSIYYYK